MMDLTKISFEEFNNNISKFDDITELIIDDGDWLIIRDKTSGKYFINALYCNDFYEVKPIGKLEYDAKCNVQFMRHELFDYNDYDFGGEQTTEDKIILWQTLLKLNGRRNKR